MPWARSWIQAPARRRTRARPPRAGARARSPIVCTPSASRRFAVRGPTPKIFETGSGSSTSRCSSGRITRKPSGLSRSRGELGEELRAGATPTEATRPSSRRMSRLIARPISTASPKSRSQPATSRKASSSESGSTSGVYERKSAMMRRLSAMYFSKSAGSSTSSGQRRLRLRRRHRRAHAEGARLVARRRDHAAPGSRPADRHRAPRERRVVADLDRRVEGVHVDVQDREGGGHGPPGSPGVLAASNRPASGRPLDRVGIPPRASGSRARRRGRFS